MKEEISQGLEESILFIDNSLQNILSVHKWGKNKLDDNRILDISSTPFQDKQTLVKIKNKVSRMRNLRNIEKELNKFLEKQTSIIENIQAVANEIKKNNL